MQKAVRRWRVVQHRGVCSTGQAAGTGHIIQKYCARNVHFLQFCQDGVSPAGPTHPSPSFARFVQ